MKYFRISALFVTMGVAIPHLFAVEAHKSSPGESHKNTHSKTPKAKRTAEHLLYMDLPEPARKALDSKVLKSDILEISKYEQDNKIFYSVKIKKMEKVGHLLVSENGVFLKTDSKHEPQKDQNEKVRFHKEEKTL
jgi:hypothetical protein